MKNKWLVDRDFETVLAEINEFVCPQVVLEIKPITTRADQVLFGCYIPAMPRMTSIISGRIMVKRLADNRTEFQVLDYQPWVEPFIKSLIEYISGRNL
jgi:hypothetical protein